MNNILSKCLLLACALTLTKTAATAQTLKIQAGATMSSLNCNLAYSKLFGDPIVSPYLLAGIDFMDKKYFSLSAGLGYLQKGGSDKLNFVSIDDPEGTVSTQTAHAKADYITANAAFNFKLLPGRRLTPYLSAGPRIDMLLSANNYLKAVSGSDGVKNINLGLNLGAGLNYTMGKYLVGLKADYLANFTGVGTYDATTPDGHISHKVQDKTFACSIVLGMRLH